MLTTKIKKVFPLLILSILGLSLASCGEKAHVHDYIYHEALQATCTSAGSIAYYTCSGCEEMFSDDEGTLLLDVSIETNKLEHTYGEYTVSKEPTCTEAGTKDRYCTVCNNKDSASVDAVHKFEESLSHDSTTHYHACSECSEKANVENHDYVNRICTVCNYETYTAGLLFALINNDTEYSVSADEVSSGDVAIPSVYNGKKVSQIVDNAFKNKNAITSIEIPSTIRSIGVSAFEGCSGLINLVIPDSVTTIGARAFSSCSELKTVTMTKSIIFLNEYTFANCSKLETLNISSVINIENYAFANCSNLKSVVLGINLAKIGSYAFTNCQSFRTVMYEGKDLETWNYKVLISSTSNLKMINSAKLYYSEETPETTNTHWHYVEGVPTIW